MNPEDATAMAMLRAGYALDDPFDQARCLNFRVGFNDAENAALAAEAIGWYNDYEGKRVAAAIRKLRDAVRFASVQVGREGSPVVYARAWKDEVDVVMAALKEAGPDECHYANGYVRAWWD